MPCPTSLLSSNETYWSYLDQDKYVTAGIIQMMFPCGVIQYNKMCNLMFIRCLFVICVVNAHP